MRRRVSLCMIVKDEESNLPDCLRAVAGLVDEMIVVDTGSTDRTRNVAIQHGARVFDFPWGDNFAFARNESLRHATGDWIFWLDADDRIDHDNRVRLQGVIDGIDDDDWAFSMWTALSWSTGRTATVDHVRLFRRHPQIRWKYRVHEQLVFGDEWLAVRARKTGVTIRHIGYHDAGVVTRKDERNLRLLTLDDRENPGDPVIRFNMGWTCLQLRRPADALEHLERSLAVSPSNLSIVPKLYSMLVRAHVELGQYHDAVTFCAEGLKRYPSDPELMMHNERLHSAPLLAHAREYHKAGDLAAAEKLYRQVLAIDSRLEQAVYLLGTVCHAQGKLDEAVSLLRHAVALNSLHANAHNHLGVVLAQLGKVNEAVPCFQEALRLDSGFADANRNLSIALARHGDSVLTK